MSSHGGPPAQPPHPKRLPRGVRHDSALKRLHFANAERARVLESLGLKGLAMRMRESSDVVLWHCPRCPADSNDTRTRIATLDAFRSSRLDARASKKKRGDEMRRMEGLLKRVPDGVPVAWVTLTTAPVDPNGSAIYERVQHIRASLKRVRKQMLSRTYLRGGRYFIEGKGVDAGVLVHLHGIFVGLRSDHQEQLTRGWAKAAKPHARTGGFTKDGGPVEVVEVSKREAVRKVAYASKGAYFDDYSDLGERVLWGDLRTERYFRAWAEALFIEPGRRGKGTLRLSGSFGLLRGNKAAVEPGRNQGGGDGAAPDDGGAGDLDAGPAAVEETPDTEDLEANDTEYDAPADNDGSAPLSLRQCGVCATKMRFAGTTSPHELAQRGNWSVALRSDKSALMQRRTTYRCAHCNSVFRCASELEASVACPLCGSPLSGDSALVGFPVAGAEVPFRRPYRKADRIGPADTE